MAVTLLQHRCEAGYSASTRAEGEGNVRELEVLAAGAGVTEEAREVTEVVGYGELWGRSEMWEMLLEVCICSAFLGTCTCKAQDMTCTHM